MARTDNLTNFLTDVAESIREKKGTTEPILASKFDTEIANIESGSSKYAPRIIQFAYHTGTELDYELENLDTINITSMNKMFENCYYLKNLNLTNFNTSKVVDMRYMFNTCTNLASVNLSNFNTSKVTAMYSMFANCGNLINLDLSNFNTSKVTSISSIFISCSKLTSLDISSFDCSNVTSVGYAFDGCKLLNNIKGCLNNLGQAYETSKSANYSNYKLNLSSCALLPEQSIINMLNGLYDIATKGCETQQVVLGSTNLAKLTSETGQQALTSATEKGWTIS